MALEIRLQCMIYDSYSYCVHDALQALQHKAAPCLVERPSNGPARDGQGKGWDGEEVRGGQGLTHYLLC